mgnify:CR=1 FL=1
MYKELVSEKPVISTISEGVARSSFSAPTERERPRQWVRPRRTVFDARVHVADHEDRGPPDGNGRVH